MRDWTYSYKTSDGLRHEGTMSAPDRDAVYEGLRKQGIRAIRVDEVLPPVRRGFGGLRRRDWLVLISFVLLLGCIVAIAFWRMPEERRGATGTALPAARAGHEAGRADAEARSRGMTGGRQ